MARSAVSYIIRCMADDKEVVFSEKTSDKKWYLVRMMIRGPIYAKKIESRGEAFEIEEVSEKAERVVAAIDSGIVREFGNYDRRNTSIVLIGDDKQRELYEENLAKMPEPEKKPAAKENEPEKRPDTTDLE